MVDLKRSKFGERLIQLRKKAGYTQTTLAAEIGVSRRIVAYYENETDHLPADLLPAIAKALGISVDGLLGVETKEEIKPKNMSLLKRIMQVDDLPPKDKRNLLQIIDSFIERAKVSN